MARRSLTGRVAVVTGAARGVGELLARRLAARGARIALVGLEPDELKKVASGLPTDSAHWHADVTDREAMSRTAREVRDRFGAVDIVVANAGVATGGPFTDSDETAWRRVVEVNLLGSATTARAFLPALIESRGYLLQIASLASITPAPMMTAYCASKAGVEAFAHSLRAEVAHHGVAVGIAYLNWIDTDMIRDADRYPVLRELRGHMPPPARRVYPAELAAARLGSAVEHRSTALYLPRWLRLAQAARAALPPVVLRVARRELARLEAEDPMRHTGPLGAGGEADREAARPDT